MIVCLINSRQMFSLTLPEKVKGQYWVTDVDAKGKLRELISVEEASGEWLLKSNHLTSIEASNGEKVKSLILKEQGFYNLKLRNSDEKVTLFVEAEDNSRKNFIKCIVNKPTRISIGRTNENQIVYSNGYVSGCHAVLSFDGSGWSIEDAQSTNGTYVNGVRVTSRNLVAGDLIYIMGLKIIIGQTFFAINNPDGNVGFNTKDIYGYQPQAISDEEREDLYSDDEKSFFFRSPRFFREIERAVIQIDPPPTPEKLDTVPLALMLGPAMTMAMTSVSTAIMTVSNVIHNNGEIRQAIPTLIMAVSMLLGTVLWPILTKKYEKKQRKKAEKKRQKKYLEYLDTIRDEIRRTAKLQSDILNENLISIDECADRIINEKNNLWERTISHNDFLNLRVGIGNVEMDAELKHQEKKFTMQDDDLQDAMLSIGTETPLLTNVPINVSVKDNRFVGIVGEYPRTINMLKSMILQMMALHGYTELKLMLLTEDFDEAGWDFVKWVPHFWTDDKALRFIATDMAEVKELSSYMEKTILSRVHSEKDAELSPYYVIISTSKELQDKCEAFQKILAEKKNLACSLIMIGEELHEVPKETEVVVKLEEGQSRIFDKDDTSGKQQLFVPDTFNEAMLNSIAEDIANIEMDVDSNLYSLPNMLTFLEMFQVGKIEHLNSLTRWKENNPTVTLQTPIGVGTTGDTFMLDLHEKYHGPHGLVAGMTGSGKSEFIITYILSLAVNYHPDEVAFILIDYKGGGLTGAFEDSEKGIKLPHLAGTITNLDGSAIRRSLTSIQSELRRRQAIFNEARRISNEGTMDIYKYQKLYREGIVSEPVPHLFIISDEFAELKSQQPEFMEQLISTARIGRSLGVHLILATQKPNGVVDDQIWSNSKFRICLKVQDKADSQDMIKCPDAAELVQTGRFYLQVGFNELFALGQSAWCGAPYTPVDTLEKTKDDSIQVVDKMGRPLVKISPDRRSEIKEKRFKQIVEVVNYLSALAEEEKIEVRPLWLPPIPDHIYVDDLEEKYQIVEEGTVLAPLVGEYDDPFNQQQNPLRILLSQEGNCIIYGSAGNGKTTFVTSLCYSLIKHHTAEEVNLYIMDFGSETLNIFNKAPQVGDVVFSSEEEKVRNLLKMLLNEISVRKNLFSEYGGEYQSYVNRTGNVIPNIVVVLNNYSGFAEMYEDYIETLTVLTRDGVKYGIYFIVTVNSVNDIRYKVSQNFKQSLTMQLNEESDYPVVVGRTEGLVPSKFKGRGLINLGSVYELQIAYCQEADDMQEFIRQYSKSLAENSKKHAKRIPILPEVVNEEYFSAEEITIDAIPVGVTKNSLETVHVNLEKRVAYPFVADDLVTMEAFINEFMKVVQQLSAKVTLLDAEKLTADEGITCDKYTNGFEDLIKDMFTEMVQRNNDYKDANMDLSVLEKYDERVYVIVGVKRLFDQLTPDGREKLSLLIEKADAAYKIHFVMFDAHRQINPYNIEPWFRMHLSGQEGIWLGEGVADQYMLKINKITTDLYSEIGEEYGYLIRGNKPILSKFLTTRKEDM